MSPRKLNQGEVDQDARDIATAAMHRIDKHEDICAERYKALDGRLASGTQRMQRIEYILYAVVALLALGEGTVLDVMKRVFLPG